MRRGTFLPLVLLLLGAPALAAAPPAVDQNGHAHSLQPPFEGPVLVDFAATWCAPCRISLPRVEILAREHPELRVLVVSVDSTPEARDRLVRDLGLTLPVLWDEDHRIAAALKPPAMPSTLLLGPDGRILHRAAGSGLEDWEALVAAIERLVGGGAGSAAD